MVGSANGRSMIASTSRLPTNSSRTSTQAMSSPNTRLSTVTATARVTVTRKDSTAAREATAATKLSAPAPPACQTIAANGSSTITDSHPVAMPTRNPVPPWRRSGRPRDTAGAGALIRWPPDRCG